MNAALLNAGWPQPLCLLKHSSRDSACSLHPPVALTVRRCIKFNPVLIMQTKLILDLLMYDQQASMHKLLDA